jgi:hypothetical protein
MAISLVNIGTYAGDGTGDPIRTAFQKINDNFSQFSSVSFSGEYSSLSGTPTLATVATTGLYSSLSELPTLGSLSSLSSISDINWVGAALSVLHGGTGQTTVTSAFNSLSPIINSGDLIIGNTTGKSVRLSIGANDSVLTVVNNYPAWTAPVGPGGYNTQIQFNSNGYFEGATALIYNQTGTYLTISSLSNNGVPLNINVASSQTGDLLDFTVSGNTQGSLAKFVANGALYIQGNPLSATSLELNGSHFYGQYFQTKTSSGSYGSYMRTVDGNEMRFYQANGDPILSIGLGNDCFLQRYDAGTLYQHNNMNPCIFRVFNWWQDDNNWEACGFDWDTEVNVCRFGTQHSNGNVRELHFMTGGTVGAKIDAFQNFIAGPALGVIDQSAINGFLYVPSMNGAPLATPTFFDGMCPFIINQYEAKISVSINGDWWHVPLVSGI